MSGRLSSWEPLLHINTHQHLKKTMPTARMSRWRVYKREDSFWTSLKSPSRNKVVVFKDEIQTKRYLPCSGTWYSSCTVGSITIKESCMIRSFTAAKTFHPLLRAPLSPGHHWELSFAQQRLSVLIQYIECWCLLVVTTIRYIVWMNDEKCMHTTVNEVAYVNRIQCCQNLTDNPKNSSQVKENKPKKKNIRKHALLSKLRFPPIHRVVVPKVSSIEADRWNAACKAWLRKRL